MFSRRGRMWLPAVFALGLVAPAASVGRGAEEQPAILDADHQFVEAANGGSGLSTLLDGDFTWTDQMGATRSRAEVLKNAPPPALGDEKQAAISQLTYGQVRAVMAARDRIQVLRIWVKRTAGWRLLVYQEVKLSEQPPAVKSSGVADCENPCKSVPFSPKNASERSIIESWQALETGVTHHDAEAWAPHIADEFVMVSSSNDHPFTKADRIGVLNLQKQTGAASAPAPLVSAKMFDFGDSVVMTCLHQPHTGKPVHVSRIWINRDGKWIMAVSYQTAIQTAPAKSS